MGYRISEVEMKNFGTVQEFTNNRFSKINLIIGENGTGKTFLLKALYSAVRTMEEYMRGDDIRTVNEILAHKLRWTFQVDRLGDLVNRGTEEGLSLSVKLENEEIKYQFSQSAASRIMAASISNSKAGNSIFIPAKEVLSLFSVIEKSREVDKVFGFDDTYYDLVKALRISPSHGRNYSVFAMSRKVVNDVIDGKVEYDEEREKWTYKNRKNQKFSIGATSEGVKKIAIMDRLLANGYLNANSIIFFDEIESALHPKAVCQLLDMIDKIACDMGIQVFIASHSYFVLKKLQLIAMRESGLVSCISLSKEQNPYICDLHEDRPTNSIIDTSIALYEQEIEEVL